MSRAGRLRPCLDCGTLARGTSRCSACTARRSQQRDAGRGSTSERGYGPAHQALRRRLLAGYDPSDPCPRCRAPLGPDPDAIHLGHTDDRTAYLGLEHAHCNLRAGGLTAQRKRAASRRSTIPRQWWKSASEPTRDSD